MGVKLLGLIVYHILKTMNNYGFIYFDIYTDFTRCHLLETDSFERNFPLLLTYRKLILFSILLTEKANTSFNVPFLS